VRRAIPWAISTINTPTFYWAGWKGIIRFLIMGQFRRMCRKMQRWMEWRKFFRIANLLISWKLSGKRIKGKVRGSIKKKE